MRRFAAKFLIFAISACTLVLFSGEASANKLDLTIARFIECDPTGATCVAHNDAYEAFMAEYSFGVAPKILAPASSLGYSGFYLGIESSVMTIPKSTQFNGSNYADARWHIGTGEYNATPPAMFFPTLHVRKGLPWSLELGSSIGYLANSELVTLGGEVKWSVFEGYRHKFRGALPDLAARGTVNRILGQSDVDMTLIGVDGSISYPFGIGGMISIEPFAGYQFMWTIIRTEPMLLRDEATVPPALHPSGGATYNASEAGMTGPNLTRNKIFFGLNLRYELLSLTMDWAWGLPKDWTTTQPGATPSNITVHVDTQFAFSFGAGLQF